VSNYGFEVQRAKSNIQILNWQILGFVEGQGNSNSPKEYTFIDDNIIAGKYSFRLKQIDNDGTYEYSKSISIDFGTPAKFDLEQNYPNPFNPSTTIKYSIIKTGKVKLAVYDILGREVLVLADEVKESGFYEVNFDASYLSSGVYFYRLVTENYVSTKKMLLLK